MEYLDYEGLKYYHELLKDKLSKIKTEAVSESTYLPGDNITIENNVISAEVPEYQAGDNIVITDGVISAVIPEQESEHAIAYASTAKQQYNDDKIYFTTDTREIYRNGISYGGSIGAETSTTLPTETLSNKVLKDTASNTKFYPVTHVDAVVGINKYAEKQSFVDLGLSVKWATCNIGAANPEDAGDYFAWGETAPKTSYSWSSYTLCNGSSSSLTKYTTSDGKTKLEPGNDAAFARWGGDSCLPSKANWDELRTKCTWTWTTQNGKSGYKVTGPNGNSIFLPAAGYKYNSYTSSNNSYGYYWASEVGSSKTYGQSFMFYSSSKYASTNYRYYGQSVRAVCPIVKAYDSTKTQAQALAAGTDDVVYYTTDTKQIYLNGNNYGGSIIANNTEQSATDGNSIKELQDVVNNTPFYPQTHVDAVSGIDAYAEKTWVEENYVTTQIYEDDTKALAGILNTINATISWQDE